MLYTTQAECELAIRTTKALGLDFAGVDLLFANGTKHGANVVCEVNRMHILKISFNVQMLM